MADEQMTLQQFGASVKAKYPAYSSKSDEEVGQAMLKKYPQYRSRVKTQKSVMQLLLSRDPSLTDIQPHNLKSLLPGKNGQFNAGAYAHEAGIALSNIGAGGLSVLEHPVETAKGVGRLLADPFTPGHPESVKIASSLLTQPLETAESAVGQSAVMGGAGELGEAGLKGVGRVLTKTGPKVAGELAKETAAANEAATAKAAEETAKQQQAHQKEVEKAEGKRKVELGKHFEKTQEAKAARGEHRGVLGEEHELTPTEKVSRKGAIERGVERLDTEVLGDVTKLEEKVNKEGNKKYNELKKVLKNEKADRVQAVDEQGQPVGQPKNITEHLDDVAHAALRGTESETPIMKSLGKRVENGEIDLTYDDLQGYREEIGRELRKGTLPPDVYTSYKNLMGAIDDAMDKIATRKGLKPLQDAARAYWGQYADTFLDSDSPFRKWKNAAGSPNYRPGMGASFIKNADTGIQAIAKYDPEVAQRLNSLRGYQAEAKALPSKTGKLAPLPGEIGPKPPLPPKPPPVQPVLKKIEPEDISGVQQASLQSKGIPRIRKVGHGMVTAAVGIPALLRAFHGNLAGIPGELLEAGAGYTATEAFARLLENKSIQRILTNPTPADVAQIPPGLRGNLQPILDAAKARGIKVSQALYPVGAVTQRKRVGDILQPVQ